MLSTKRKLITITALLIALTLVFCIVLTSCSDNEGDFSPETTTVRTGENATKENTQTTEVSDEDEPTVSPSKEAPTVSNVVTKYKRYEMRQGEGDYYIVFLRYREGSTSVAEMTGAFAYPYETENIDELIESDDLMIQEIESLGIEEAHIDYTRMSNGIEGNFQFVDLDSESNSATVNIAARYLSMPMEKDFSFNIQNCEKTLAEFGFELVDEN